MSEVPNSETQSLNVELNESLDRCRALVDEFRDRLVPAEAGETPASDDPSVLGLQAGTAQQF